MIDASITNGQVIDGSGSPRFFAAVAVSGDTVTIHRDGEVPYRLIAQTMSPSGREFYPLTRSEHLDVLAFRPYTSQPNIGNVLASCMSMWNLLERSTLRPLSMSNVATLIFSFIAHLSDSVAESNQSPAAADQRCGQLHHRQSVRTSLSPPGQQAETKGRMSEWSSSIAQVGHDGRQPSPQPVRAPQRYLPQLASAKNR